MPHFQLHYCTFLVDSSTFSGVKKFFGADKGDKEFVDPFTIVKFAGKEVNSGYLRCRFQDSTFLPFFRLEFRVSACRNDSDNLLWFSMADSDVLVYLELTAMQV